MPLFAAGLLSMTACNTTQFAGGFEDEPATAGWVATTNPKGSVAPSWDGPPQAVIRPGDGTWDSPRYDVEFPEWYRVTVNAHSASGWSYVGAMFADENGDDLIADHYERLENSDGFVDHVGYVRAKANAAQGFLRFTGTAAPGKPVGELAVAGVKVDHVSRKAVLDWHDKLYATLPPVTLDLPVDHWKHLPRTRKRIEKGGKLRIVLLGDSIANDSGTSPWELVLERANPGVRIEAITSVRGGTGMWWYAQKNRVKEWVIDYEPDLLIMMGISHRERPEPFGEIVKQVREQSANPPEFLFMNGAFSTESQPVSTWNNIVPTEQAIIRNDLMARRLSQTAAAHDVPFVNLRQIWRDYLASHKVDQSYFRRDAVHANNRGRTVMARILSGLLTPPDED